MGGLVLTVALVLAITPESKLVIQAGRDYRVGSIQSGVMNKTLQRFAEEHAAYMAENCQQGHQNWEQRFHQLERLLPGYTGFREIAAESWDWQDDKESAPEMFKCWEQSPGHWEVANGRCAIWGYSMARGSNGIYYGCGIVGQRRFFGRKHERFRFRHWQRHL